MLKEIIIKAKSEAEALALGTSNLKIAEDYLFAEKLNNEEYKVFANVSLKLAGKRYLENIFKELELDLKLEIRTISETEITFLIDTERNALIIGKDGKTLSAIQVLLRLYLEQFSAVPLIISVDVAGYNEHRKYIIEKKAVSIAKRVIQSKKDFKLEPMNSFERRVVHSRLAKMKNVETVSEGTGKDRAVIIKYLDK